MKLYHHILVATDLSDGCLKVAKQARQLADAMGAKLSLVHIVEPIPAYGYPGILDLQSPFIDQAKEEVAKLSETIGIAKEAQYVELGSVKTQILNVAAELNIDLIVIGSHGRHGLSRLLGSTTSAVIHGANCDVLTVRATE